MRLNAISSAPGARKPRKRVGRGIGSGLGKTAGRGHKGQKSRTGGGVSAAFEGGQMPIQRRLPKVGFSSRKGRFVTEVRLHELSAVAGEEVTLDALKSAGVITRNILKAKIIASGEVARAFSIKGVAVTRGAREAIEKAGGKVKA